MKFNIWKDCPKVPITELLSFIVDNRGKTVPTANDGWKLIATNCVTNNTLFPVYEKVRYLTQETYETWFRAHPMPGDILFVNKGTPGRVCMVPDPVDFCIAQDMIALRADDKKIYNKYLFAVLRSREIQQQIYNTNVGDVIPHFKKQFMDQLLIPVPDRKIQEKIGNLYYQLSYKVELNKKINENLERQAQAYFEELFVVNADPNWPECTLSDIGSIVAGGTPSKSKSEYYADQGIAWITPKDLSVDKSKFISHGENDISELGFSKSSTQKMPAGTVLFSSRAPIGYIAIAKNELTTNQGFKSVIPNENIGTSYVYFLLKNLLPTIEGMASGSTFKEISGAGMKSVPTVMPDVNIIQLFNNFCEPIFKEQEVLEAENRRLSTLRDSLLPKLMSGEIDISSLNI
ncbi:EcoKI restriction-modification system protein HsdS [Anaerobutyricum hallii]|uniref:EcoKI restriction-modification system protein HsdS n=1 Tax=Anaerobutyricum hallii TaxID=39488 RepID=A0A173Y6T4_9FIRM|nr:restriction endonuclease subunit S [Anaerobutyricum hallii]GFO89963.1 type I restriction system specificity protein [Anaerobutyricum hallii]CUN59403.1 EcoKI restriction-modification system protein HsdS [Anaerobutyricum hallii]